MKKKKINKASVDIIKVLAQYNLSPKEGLEAVMKSMHFIIEKGFCQTEEKTCELVSKAIGQMTMATAIPQN